MRSLSTSVEVRMSRGDLVAGHAKETTDISVTVLAVATICRVQIVNFLTFGIEARCIQDSRFVAPTTLVLVFRVEAHMVSAVEMKPLLWLHNQRSHICTSRAMIIMLPRLSMHVGCGFVIGPSPKQCSLAIMRNALHEMLAGNYTAIESHSFMEIMLVVPVTRDMEPLPALLLVRWVFVKHCIAVTRCGRVHVIQSVFVTIVRSEDG
jgi:hypothetical protein